MSMPPPPTSGPQGSQGYQPPGYQPYGAMQPAQQGNSGMAVASLVLSLVGRIPCVWGLQIPGLLGTIFGFIGMQRTADKTRRGSGLASAGLVVGLGLVVVCGAGGV